MKKSQVFTQSEIRVLVQIGISAGQVTFAALFVALLPFDKNGLPVLLLSLGLTLFFWGSSWFLTRRYKL